MNKPANNPTATGGYGSGRPGWTPGAPIVFALGIAAGNGQRFITQVKVRPLDSDGKPGAREALDLGPYFYATDAKARAMIFDDPNSACIVEEELRSRGIKTEVVTLELDATGQPVFA